MPAEAPEGQAAVATVDLSSDDSGGGEEEDEEEEEERDSEATIDEMGKTSPWHCSSALRSMPNDDEAGARREGEDSPLVTRMGRSGLVPPGSVLVPGRSEASSNPPDVHSTSRPPEADPSCRLSGFKFGRRLLEFTSDDQ